MDLVNRLCYLFGDEEHVNYRKQLVLLREDVFNILSKGEILRYMFICSGSLGEGVAYPRSDDDLMIYPEDSLLTVRTTREDTMLHRGILMIPCEFSPGFCLLVCYNDCNEVFAVDISGTKYLSSIIFRDYFVQEGAIPHGPCSSYTLRGISEFDWATCLRCCQWPVTAEEWVLRERRYNWPSRRQIQNIIREGCHVVPIGNPDSPVCDLEWRISFSLAERTLIHSFNHVQFLIYNLLKLVLKRVIDIDIPNVLCSYFMKTVMFYAIENTSCDLWVPTRISECYNKCLLLLYYFVDRMICPSYFIPDNNMMRRKVNVNNRPLLLSVITELMSRGITGSLYLCKESDAVEGDITSELIEMKCNCELLHGYLWTYDEFGFLFFKKEYRNTNEFFFDLHKVFVLTFNSHSHVYSQGHPDLTRRMLKRAYSIGGHKAMLLSQHSTINKDKLGLLKSGQSLLRLGCSSDVSSGKLLLATHMYMIGKFNQSLHLINQVLSDISPFTMTYYRSSNLAAELYMTHVCGKGYSLGHKIRAAWAFDVLFEVEYLKCVPVPIRMLLVIVNRHIPIHPLLYAFLIQGLCFYHMGNNECFPKSISSLTDTMKDLEIDGYEWDAFCGKIVVGYMRMLQHDYQAALCSFTSAYLMDIQVFRKCNISKDSTLYLIACLLNHAVG